MKFPKLFEPTRIGTMELKNRLVSVGIGRQEKADLIALGRPLLADPEWPLKVMEGKEDEITVST